MVLYCIRVALDASRQMNWKTGIDAKVFSQGQGCDLTTNTAPVRLVITAYLSLVLQNIDSAFEEYVPKRHIVFPVFP